MLKLSKAQYKQLCADCAAEMMRGAGHGGKIPDFSGTDMTFYVKDPKLKGGGFTGPENRQECRQHAHGRTPKVWGPGYLDPRINFWVKVRYRIILPWPGYRYACCAAVTAHRPRRVRSSSEVRCNTATPS